MCQTLTHPHIVGLLDILEIDNSSFATILDLCEGPDLDAVLREHGVRGGEVGRRHQEGDRGELGLDAVLRGRWVRG